MFKLPPHNLSSSGVAPVHWRVQSLRSVIRPRGLRNRPDLPLLSVARERGVFIRGSDDANHNAIPDDLSNYKVALTGDLVINKMKAWQGSLGIAPCDGIVSPAYFVYELDLANRHYGSALFRSRPYVAQFAAASDGVRVGQWDLYKPRMREILVTIPPADEQHSIVKYLNHASSRVDRAIASNRKLIDLLEEQKRAVVHHAVVAETYDASQSVEIRSPDTRELKYVLRELVDCEHKTAPYEERGSHFVLRTSAIRNGQIQWSGTYPTSESAYAAWTQRAVPESGDVVLTREAPAGEAAVVPSGYNVCLGQRTVLLKLKRDVMDPDYLVFQIMSGALRDQITLASQGSTVPHLNMDDIGRIRVSVPALSAQRATVQRIKKECRVIEDAVLTATREVELLREFKASLASDVVTGRVDVRGAVAGLPETDHIEVEDYAFDDEDVVMDEVQEYMETGGG